jgi:hypothetical protein
VVRKYISGTRSRHGKIASIVMDEEAKGPDEKGMWTMGGSYITEDGDREQFTASVTSRGEVLLTITPKVQDTGGKHQSKFTKRRSRPSLKRNEAT